MANDPGWYPDPYGEHLARWWDGARWTVRVALQVEEDIDPRPGLAPIPPPVASARIGPAPGRVTVPRPPAGAGGPGPASWTPPPPVAPGGPGPVSSMPPPPAFRPSAARAWWQRTVHAVSADLAVHGLAYLGVLLLFTGVFGFVAFAFGDVDRSLRPLAELVIAASFFGVSAFLYRRGLPVVAAALGLLGGTVVPVLVIASLSDNADIPPDPDGTALVVWLAAANAVVAAVYLAVALRRPTSPLRFVAAPTIWLAAAAIGMAFVDPIPSGDEITTTHPPEWAVAALAVAVTAVVARRASGAVSRATIQVAAPGSVLVYLLTIIASAQEDWTAGWLALAAVATVVTLDVVRGFVRPDVVEVAQPLVIAAAAATLVDGLGWGWAGACAVAAVVVIGERSTAAAASVAGSEAASVAGSEVAAMAQFGGPGGALITVLRLAVLAGGVAAAGAAPWPSLVAAGLLFAVGLLRLERPHPWLVAPSATVLVTAAPVPAASAALRLLDPGPGLAVVAACVLAVAAVVRATHRVDRAPWRWWVPAAAAVTVLGGCAVSPGWGALAAATAAAAILLAGGPVPARVWAAAAGLAVAGTLAATSLDITWHERSIVSAGAGVALVAVAATIRRPLVGHLGCIGHLATAGAIPMALAGANSPVASDAGAITIAAFAVASVLTAAAHELGGSPVVGVFARAVGSPVPGGTAGATSAAVDLAPLFVAVPAVAAAVGAVTSRLATLDWYDPWCATAAGVAMGATAVAGRPLQRRDARAGRVVNAIAVALLALVAVPVSVPGPVAGAVTAAVLIATVAASGTALRVQLMCAAAWAASFTGVLDIAHALGVEASALHHVALSWGLVALFGAFGVDALLEGRGEPGQLLRRSWLRPAVVLVPVVVAGGLVVSYGAGGDGVADGPHVWGGWSLAVAIAAAFVAQRGRVADPTVVTWSLLVVAWAGLVPDDPLRPPWPYVVVAGVMAVVAFAVRGRAVFVPPGGSIVAGRWDVPPLAAGAATLVFALSVSVVEGWVPATFLGGGFVVAAVGVAFGWTFLVPVGVVLAVCGAIATGNGGAALAFAVISVLATATATRSAGAVRRSLQWCGSLAAGAAWVELVLWRHWEAGRGGAATALASGGALLVLALALRFAGTGHDWVPAWALPASVGLGAAAFVVLGSVEASAAAEGVLAAGIASAALACAFAAAPLRVAVLRDASGALAVAAAVVLGRAGDVGPTAAVLLALAGAIVATTFVVACTAAQRGPTWIRPALMTGLGATVAAFAVAVEHLPERGLLTAALAATGLEAAALGLSGRGRGYLLASPAILCAAWITFASGSLTGDPQWFTVPVGLTVLVVVGLARADLRRSGQPVDAPVVVTLDVVGMAFVVGAALGRTATESIAYGAAAVGLGLGIAIWAVLTKVRRRLAVGVGSVILAVVLMLVGPLVQIVPQIHGAALWLVIAAIGALAIVVAALVERGRAAVRTAVAGIRVLTDGWE